MKAWPQTCLALWGSRGRGWLLWGGAGIQGSTLDEETVSSPPVYSVSPLRQLLPCAMPSPLFTFQNWLGATFSRQPSLIGPQPIFLGAPLTGQSLVGDLSLYCTQELVSSSLKFLQPRCQALMQAHCVRVRPWAKCLPKHSYLMLTTAYLVQTGLLSPCYS